ncbi:lipase family protein [Flavihumibacter sp. CACIAM 22H1]|uniref:lipase family protein n=1 Tax=Flavihumibacter sp. CACIAM 22H1 TaxID=1812911 RepID=UPI0007A7ED60|nr:lipase family protein [Flavihumibacter sp. CACIAM 22H1]KYP16399.1 MAG: lipase [Flavihumibacter sp. CACIAM 22H1]
MRIPTLLLLLVLVAGPSQSQSLQPGFDKLEYEEMIKVSVRTTKAGQYADTFPPPIRFRMVYESPEMGLQNLWDLWTDDKGQAVISIRGTTQNMTSWLANLYAAMVPATGSLQLEDGYSFEYRLAAHPQAAVHVGWLLSTGYLARDILPRLDSLHKTGTKNVLIMGHSQGGGIAFLLTSYLYSLQESGKLPADIRFKTYCSAGPKPGNLYYAYDYEAKTYGGWAFNVVNAADWVPEVPLSIQTVTDFNVTNPFTNAKKTIRKQKFPNKLVLKYVYNRLSKPSIRAQRNYQKYLGKHTSKIVGKNLKGFQAPAYYNSNHYVRTGATIVLQPDDAYRAIWKDSDTNVFVHHVHAPYLFLLHLLP